MICPICSREIIDGAAFCPLCGSQIAAPSNQPAFDAAANTPEFTIDDSFEMIIKDAMNITGIGLILIGSIEKGEISVNQQVAIPNFSDDRYTVTGIERDRQRVEKAQQGDSISAVLKGLNSVDKSLLIGKSIFSVSAAGGDATDYQSLFSDLAQPTSAPNQNPPVNYNNPQNPPYGNNDGYAQPQYAPNNGNLSAVVNLRTGSGITEFSAMNAGRITVTQNGVSYENKFGGSSKSHFYTFDQIAQTQFKMTHAGLQPYLGYIVDLKDGTSYTYIYSAFVKGKLQSIDSVIRSNMTR